METLRDKMLEHIEGMTNPSRERVALNRTKVELIQDRNKAPKMSPTVKARFLDETQAIIFIYQHLTKAGVYNRLTCQVSTLLREGRRSPALLTKGGTIQDRGNRHRFGHLKHYSIKGAACYTRADINDWLISAVIPYLLTLPVIH